MTLDDLLKHNTAFIDQALKRRLFDKLDEKTVNFPEEQRQRRMGELKARIADLTRRKEEAVAAYESAIAREKAELDALVTQRPATPQIDPGGSGPDPLSTKPVRGKTAKDKP